MGHSASFIQRPFPRSFHFAGDNSPSQVFFAAPKGCYFSLLKAGTVLSGRLNVIMLGTFARLFFLCVYVRRLCIWIRKFTLLTILSVYSSFIQYIPIIA